jgi:hypothetical protein
MIMVNRDGGWKALYPCASRSVNIPSSVMDSRAAEAAHGGCRKKNLCLSMKFVRNLFAKQRLKLTCTPFQT